VRLVLVTSRDTRPKRLGYFQSEARQLARSWGANTDTKAVGNGGDIVDAIAATDELISHLAIVSHGYTDRIVGKWRGVRVGRHVPPRVVSLEYLLEVLVPRVTQDVHVALCACWTASNRRKWLRNPALYGPGGQHSFAGRLYRGLVTWAPDCCVMGHTRRGPTTEAPHLRAWGGRYGVGEEGRGTSVLDYHLGAGAHLSPTMRRLWRCHCERVAASGLTGAESLLSGVVPRWLTT